MKTFLYYLIMVSYAIAFIFVGALIYWQVRPYDPVDFQGKITLSTLTPHVGDTVVYTTVYCKNTKLVSTVYRQIVDGVIYNMDPVRGTNPPGCRTTRVQFTIPNVPPGKYHLRNVYEYDMAPLRTVRKEVESVEFLVLPATKSATIL